MNRGRAHYQSSGRLTLCKSSTERVLPCSSGSPGAVQACPTATLPRVTPSSRAAAEPAGCTKTNIRHRSTAPAIPTAAGSSLSSLRLDASSLDDQRQPVTARIQRLPQGADQVRTSSHAIIPARSRASLPGRSQRPSAVVCTGSRSCCLCVHCITSSTHPRARQLARQSRHAKHANGGRLQAAMAGAPGCVLSLSRSLL